MSIRFNRENLLPGDILAVRSPSFYGKSIRGLLRSFTNHNALIVRDGGGLVIGEAITPRICLTPLEVYERAMNERELKKRTFVWVWRVSGLTDQQRLMASDYFLANKLGVPYPVWSVPRLWVYRFVNTLPWKIEGEWCTRVCRDSIEHVKSKAFRDPTKRVGYRKKNMTPGTFENRLIVGCFDDVTSSTLTKT